MLAARVEVAMDLFERALAGGTESSDAGACPHHAHAVGAADHAEATG